MRRLSLSERLEDSPEEAFLVAAGDAGAHVAHDRDGYVLTFDDKDDAEAFLADHNFPDRVKVWRDQREDGDRFVMEVDRQTAREAFTPEPDDYATEVSEAMRVKDLGGDFSVTVPAADVEAFKKRWPGSELPDRAITFTFDKKNGDLVDIYPDGVDGEDARALSQDAQNFGAKKLSLGVAAMREAAASEKPIGSGENGYIAFYKDKRYEVYGDTILGAQTTLAQALKIPPQKQYKIHITLAQKGGVDVVHTPTESRSEVLGARVSREDWGAVGAGDGSKAFRDMLSNFPDEIESIAGAGDESSIADEADRIAREWMESDSMFFQHYPEIKGDAAAMEAYRKDYVGAFAKAAMAWYRKGDKAEARGDIKGSVKPGGKYQLKGAPADNWFVVQGVNGADYIVKGNDGKQERFPQHELERGIRDGDIVKVESRRLGEAEPAPAEEDEPVVVLFRKWPDGDIDAVFPGLQGTAQPGSVTVYTHVGQHGSGDFQAIMQKTKAALPSEYEALEKELESIGYKLIPRSRAGQQDLWWTRRDESRRLGEAESAAEIAYDKGYEDGQEDPKSSPEDAAEDAVATGRIDEKDREEYDAGFALGQRDQKQREKDYDFAQDEARRLGERPLKERGWGDDPPDFDAEGFAAAQDKYYGDTAIPDDESYIERDAEAAYHRQYGDPSPARLKEYKPFIQGFMRGAEQSKMDKGESLGGRAATKEVTPEERIAQFREIVQHHQHAKIDGVGVDAFSASGVVQVYDALSRENKEKFAAMPVAKMVNTAWKLIGKTTGEATGMVVPPSADEAFFVMDIKTDDLAERRAPAKEKVFGGWEALAKVTAYWNATIEIPLGARPGEPYKVIFRHERDAPPFIAALQKIGIDAQEKFTPTVGSGSKLVEVPRAEADAKAREIAALRPKQS